MPSRSDARKRFFIERANRKRMAQKGAETRKARKAQEQMLAAAGWTKKGDQLDLFTRPVVDDLDDSLEGFLNGE